MKTLQKYYSLASWSLECSSTECCVCTDDGLESGLGTPLGIDGEPVIKSLKETSKVSPVLAAAELDLLWTFPLVI